MQLLVAHYYHMGPLTAAALLAVSAAHSDSGRSERWPSG
jgi:hypothetical protein